MSNLVKTRKVIILFTQTATRETFDTTAQTWGELQREMKGSTDNKRFVVRETKNTLESTEALLPTGDFVVFAYPKESKAGAKKAAKKSAKKSAKKAAKKPAKKAAKKSAPKKAAKKKASGGVSTKKSEKISETVGALATDKKRAQEEQFFKDLNEEAREVKNTIPGR